MNESSAQNAEQASPAAHPLIDKLTALFQSFDLSDINKLDDLYHPEVKFQDPFHQVDGLAALKHYFERLYTNVDSCRFEFHRHLVHDHVAFLTWTMHLAHPKLNRGRIIHVEGVSELRFYGKVLSHRDYFDGGQMLYEQLPLLGHIVQHIKKRL